jgi:hypothetical protein
MFMNWREMIKPNKIEVESTDAYGKFVCEPLERGFGITIGNSLRRIILSSLYGAAVTSVRIDGVMHEFSVVPDVLEDVSEIILNLKGSTLQRGRSGPEGNQHRRQRRSNGDGCRYRLGDGGCTGAQSGSAHRHADDTLVRIQNGDGGQVRKRAIALPKPTRTKKPPSARFPSIQSFPRLNGSFMLSETPASVNARTTIN